MRIPKFDEIFYFADVQIAMICIRSL